MFLLSTYPTIDRPDLETQVFLKRWHTEDNLFRATTRHISYKKNVGNFSIKATLKGKIRYGFDGLERLVEPGSFLVINKNIPYSCTISSTEPVEDICIQLTESTIQEACRTHCLGDLKLLDHSIGNVFRELPIETLYQDDTTVINYLKQLSLPDLDNFCRDEIKLRLIHYFFSKHVSELGRRFERIDSHNAAVRNEILRRVNLAKDYIHSNYAAPIELCHIARCACLSTSHLLKKFKEVMGVTPYQYLTELRLNRAVYLLSHSTLPVAEITVNVGFESPSSFIRLFRERLHLTPNNFRKDGTNGSVILH